MGKTYEAASARGVLAGSIVEIGCRSLKIHRVELSVDGGKLFMERRAAVDM